jgi:hypothetical protein
MADLTATAAAIAVVFPLKATIHTVIAGAAITAGQPVYVDSNGKGQLGDASAAGTAGVRGIALQSVGAGQALNILKEGHLEGCGVSGLTYDDPVYLSDTAGTLADAAGTVSKIVGRVAAMTEKDLTKVLYVDLPWN